MTLRFQWKKPPCCHTCTVRVPSSAILSAGDLIKSGMLSPAHDSAAGLDAGINDRVTADTILAEYEATFEHCEGLSEEHPAADKIAMLKVGFLLLAQPLTAP